MTLTPVLETHIFLDEKGTAWVKRAGVAVKQIVETLRQVEYRPEEVVRHFPYLMRSEVHAVLAYYYDHRAEIDEQLRLDSELAQSVRAGTAEAPATTRLPSREAAMSLRLLMDVHVPAEIAERLREAGVEVLTAQEDGSDRLADESLMDRAYTNRWALFTNDVDFLQMAATRQRAGVPFGCVFFAVQDVKRSREYAQWLEVYAKLSDWEEMVNRVVFIP